MIRLPRVMASTPSLRRPQKWRKGARFRLAQIAEPQRYYSSIRLPVIHLPASLIPLGGAYSNRSEQEVRGFKKSRALTGCFDDIM